MKKENDNVKNENAEAPKYSSSATNIYAANILQREHNEFHNCYTVSSVKEDIAFLRLIYGDKMALTEDSVDQDFVNKLKVISKDIYFFLKTLEIDLTPQNYIKSKYEFIKYRIPNGDPPSFLSCMEWINQE